MKVTAENLTDDDVRNLGYRSEEWVEWRNQPTLQLGWYMFDALHAQNEFKRRLAREVCAAAINARKEIP